MIKCRICEKEFPKPTTRGRPPVKCEDCRKVRIKKSTGPVKTATLPTKITKLSARLAEKNKPTKGNSLYSVSDLMERLEENPNLGARLGRGSQAQEIASIIRSLNGRT